MAPVGCIPEKTRLGKPGETYTMKSIHGLFFKEERRR
jgi:hypothetical protein